MLFFSSLWQFVAQLIFWNLAPTVRGPATGGTPMVAGRRRREAVYSSQKSPKEILGDDEEEQEARLDEIAEQLMRALQNTATALEAWTALKAP